MIKLCFGNESKYFALVSLAAEPYMVTFETESALNQFMNLYTSGARETAPRTAESGRFEWIDDGTALQRLQPRGRILHCAMIAALSEKQMPNRQQTIEENCGRISAAIDMLLASLRSDKRFKDAELEAMATTLTLPTCQFRCQAMLRKEMQSMQRIIKAKQLTMDLYSVPPTMRDRGAWCVVPTDQVWLSVAKNDVVWPASNENVSGRTRTASATRTNRMKPY